jgi:hypothetical protein
MVFLNRIYIHSRTVNNWASRYNLHGRCEHDCSHRDPLRQSAAHTHRPKFSTHKRRRPQQKRRKESCNNEYATHVPGMKVWGTEISTQCPKSCKKAPRGRRKKASSRQLVAALRRRRSSIWPSATCPPATEPVVSRMASRVPARSPPEGGEEGSEGCSASSGTRTKHSCAERPERPRALAFSAQQRKLRMPVKLTSNRAWILLDTPSARRNARDVPVASTRATFKRVSVRSGRHTRAPEHAQAALACAIDSSIDIESANNLFFNQSHLFDGEL